MPRKLREQLEGGAYHVFARGNERKPIFRDEADYSLYLEILRRVMHGRGWTCSSYCLMPNHVHLLLQTPEANLSEGMQRLQSLYAQLFNVTYGRTGHLFEGRFGAVRIRSDIQFATVVDYIARNPVEAHLCERPEDWPWGSAAGGVVSGGLLGLG